MNPKIRLIFLVILPLLMLSICLSSCKKKQIPKRTSNQPNFIIIFLDDLDFDELNFYDYKKFPCYTGARDVGNKNADFVGSFNTAKFHMPNFDKFAKESAVFNRFYMPASICTPVRFALLTGMYPSKSIGFQKEFKAGEEANLRWNIPMIPSDNNIAKMMNERGYVTGLIGKWHNLLNGRGYTYPKGRTDFLNPEKNKAVVASYDYTQMYIRDSIGFQVVDRVYYDNQVMLSLEWITEGALKFIEDNKTKPFFMYMAIPLPHAQYYDYTEWDPLLTPRGILDKVPEGQPLYDNARLRNKAAGFEKRKSMATWLDDCIGAIVDKIDDSYLTDNTVIIITSDHQTRGKFTCYEGCRAPTMIRYPKLIKAGSTINELCVVTDIIPTILEIIDKKPVEQGKFDGVSLLPLFEKHGKDLPWRKSILLEINYSKGVVTNEWKYIANRPPVDVIKLMKDEEESSKKSGIKRIIAWDGNSNPHPQWDNGGVIYGNDRDFPFYFDADQLYNLKTDVFEQHNLAYDPKYASVLAEMKQLLKEHLVGFPHKFGEFTDGIVTPLK